MVCPLRAALHAHPPHALLAYFHPVKPFQARVVHPEYIWGGSGPCFPEAGERVTTGTRHRGFTRRRPASDRTFRPDAHPLHNTYHETGLSAMKKLLLSVTVALIGLTVWGHDASPAQYRQSLDLTLGEYGVSFGNSERTTGVRFNYRDDGRVQRVRGLNATLWIPYELEAMESTVYGVSLGLPATGGGGLHGLSAGPAGVGVRGSITGIQLGGFGVVGGRNLSGVSASGLATVAGDRLSGIGVSSGVVIAGEAVSGLAAGGLTVIGGDRLTGLALSSGAVISGGSISGISVAGLANIAGENRSGIGAGGLTAIAVDDWSGAGVGGLVTIAGGHMRGLGAGGLTVIGGDGLSGVALSAGGNVSGRNITGVTMAGLGNVARRELNIISVAGVGSAAGRQMNGLHVAGGALVAPQMNGAAVATTVVSTDTASGMFIAPAYFRVGGFEETGGEMFARHGTMKGVSISAVNDIRGLQHGVTIGLVNVARELRGVQLGLINYAGNNPAWARVLPVLNANL